MLCSYHTKIFLFFNSIFTSEEKSFHKIIRQGLHHGCKNSQSLKNIVTLYTYLNLQQDAIVNFIWQEMLRYVHFCTCIIVTVDFQLIDRYTD